MSTSFSSNRSRSAIASVTAAIEALNARCAHSARRGSGTSGTNISIQSWICQCTVVKARRGSLRFFFFSYVPLLYDNLFLSAVGISGALMPDFVRRSHRRRSRGSERQ
jgi:hypothetical protein